MRCNPPAAQTEALVFFDSMVQRCFGHLTGIHLIAQQWGQAARGVAQAGLGLRSSQAHAPAAYLASLGSNLDGCAEILSAFSAAVVRASPEVTSALQAFNSRLPDSEALTLDAAFAANQHDLSSRLDKAGWEAQLAQASPAEKAALRSEAGIGARAFLAAPPSGRTRMEPASFAAELRLRLGVPDAAEDCWCPRCDAVLDRFGHHAAVCVAGGERTQ